MAAAWSAPGRRTATAPTPANGYPAARNVLWKVRVALKHAGVSQILAHAYHVLLYIIIISYHCFFVIFFQSTTLPSTNRSSSLPWKTSQWPSGTLRSSHVPSNILANTRYAETGSSRCCRNREFSSCLSLPLLPQLACSIHATWGPLFGPHMGPNIPCVLQDT